MNKSLVRWAVTGFVVNVIVVFDSKAIKSSTQVKVQLYLLIYLCANVDKNEYSEYLLN